MLAATFVNEADYDLIREGDTFNFTNLTDFAPGKLLDITVNHADGSSDSIRVQHTYNQNQIDWFRAGSALNLIKQQNA
jgi:aconitate hydratase